MRRLIALTLLAALAAPGMSASQTNRRPPEVTSHDLATRLALARRIAEENLRLPSDDGIRRVRDAVALPAVVVFPEGDRMLLDADPFLAALAPIASGYVAAVERIKVLQRLLDRARAASPPDRSQVRAALSAAYSGVVTRPSIFERIRRWIGRALRSFLERLGSFSGSSSVVAWLLVLALLGFAVWLITRLRLVPDRRTGETEAAGKPVDWHGLAEAAMARGDQPEAVRALYRALLAALARRGVVPDSPSLTAGECRRTVGAVLPSVYPDVAQATGVFERVAYGRRPLEPGDLEAMRRAEERVAA